METKIPLLLRTCYANSVPFLPEGRDKMTPAAKENISLLEGRRGGEVDISLNTMLAPEPRGARSLRGSYLQPRSGVNSVRPP